MELQELGREITVLKNAYLTPYTVGDKKVVWLGEVDQLLKEIKQTLIPQEGSFEWARQIYKDYCESAEYDIRPYRYVDEEGKMYLHQHVNGKIMMANYETGYKRTIEANDINATDWKIEEE
jgi:hypothetical protein